MSRRREAGKTSPLFPLNKGGIRGMFSQTLSKNFDWITRRERRVIKKID